MIRIAIDGPGGAGKSSLAKAVAAKLGIIYVDTGALYRTIGLFVLNSGVDPKNAEGVCALLGSFKLDLKFENGKQIILLNGIDVGDTIRTPEVSMAASAVSAIGEVRAFLLDMQRSIAKENSVIMDGRDIGTVILPDAEVKIFLTASPEARAKRRYLELKEKGKEVPYEQVYNEMVERDTNDSTREIAPCKPAQDSIILDNSDLTAEQTVDKVIEIVKKKAKILKKANKRTAYMKNHFWMSPTIKFLNRIKVHGAENIPEKGGYILACNHIAAKDVFLLGASAKRQFFFITKKELFAIPLVRSFIKAFGGIKIDRGGNDVGAIRTSIDYLKNGKIVAIFPQGHRCPGQDPAKTPIKNGLALLAHKSKADVIPAFIKTKNNKYRPFRRIDIYFGKPIPYEELSLTNGGREEYENTTKMVFSRMLSLGEDIPKLN